MKYRVMLIALAIGVAFRASADDRSVAWISAALHAKARRHHGHNSVATYQALVCRQRPELEPSQLRIGANKVQLSGRDELLPGPASGEYDDQGKAIGSDRRAIGAKDRAKFARAFGYFIHRGNSCHQSQGYGFIVIKVPTSSPFSDELFPPSNPFGGLRHHFHRARAQGGVVGRG